MKTNIAGILASLCLSTLLLAEAEETPRGKILSFEEAMSLMEKGKPAAEMLIREYSSMKFLKHNPEYKNSFEHSFILAKAYEITGDYKNMRRWLRISILRTLPQGSDEALRWLVSLHDLSKESINWCAKLEPEEIASINKLILFGNHSKYKGFIEYINSGQSTKLANIDISDLETLKNAIPVLKRNNEIKRVINTYWIVVTLASIFYIILPIITYLLGRYKKIKGYKEEMEAKIKEKVEEGIKKILKENSPRKSIPPPEKE